MPQDPHRAWIEDETGSRYELTANFTVGRAPANNLPILDPNKTVSQFHARIDSDGSGHHFVEDRHSTNGTFVNDRRITRRELRDGDQIRFGSKAGYIFRERKVRGSVTDSDELESGMTMRHFEERQCWLMIGDVIGSSDLARRLDGQEFARLITDWAARCRTAAEANQGIMANRTGDGWLLLWEDGPEVVHRVVKTLQAFAIMQETEQPGFRLLLHRGPVTLGGGVRAGEDNVLSMELHRAFRMEKIAARLGEKLVGSEDAVEVLKTVVTCRPLPGEFELPGFSGEHRFFALGEPKLPA